MKSLRNVSVYDFNYSIIKNRDVDGIFFFHRSNKEGQFNKSLFDQ
jgi:hypothetical protein